MVLVHKKKTKKPGDSGHPAIIPHTLPSGQTFIFQKIVPADSQLLNIYIFIFLIVQTGRGNVLMSVLMLVAFCVAALSGKLNQEVLKVYTLFNTYRQIYYSLITFLQPCLTESVTLTEHHVGLFLRSSLFLRQDPVYQVNPIQSYRMNKILLKR